MSTASTTPELGQRALVLGASMAGLLAARILSERFGEVMLLERDELPDAAAARKGVPQSPHAHGLLARGCEIIESLCPGFTAALLAQGGAAGDIQYNAAFCAGGQLFARAPCGRFGIAASRSALEAELRRRVLALENVRARTSVDIVEPMFDPLEQRVTGIRIVRRDSGVEETLCADLIVDCTGRGSRTPGWLRSWGFDAPPEERIEVGIGYATAYFRRDPQHAERPVVTICPATAQSPLPGVFIAQEPLTDGVQRWVVTLGGYRGDHPSATLDGMRERAARMGCADLARIVNDAEPIGAPLRYSFPASQRRHYERLARFPGRFLVLGDALASFNPIYGQGMTVAACEALALRAALAKHGLRPALTRGYFAAAAKTIDVPWQLAVGSDLAIPGVRGPRPLPLRLVNAYIARLFRAAPHDAEVTRAFTLVTHLLAPPHSLFSPGIVARVLWHGRRRSDTAAHSLAHA
ncbi:MAG: FAD-dependent monooxygenase [Burkholderiaceae bacterium]|nr:FAD-dependent monooxygenase [Burkholderiaceae bacterium]